MKKVLVSAFPFLCGVEEQGGVQFVSGIWERKPRPAEITEELRRGSYSGLIAGTEEVENVIADEVTTLEVISRVGSGLDNVDVEYFGDRNIKVAYTPFGPVDAVAELVVGLTVAALRGFRIHDLRVRSRDWTRDFGRLISDCRFGIVGFGRIGRRVASVLQPFRCEIVLHDIDPDYATAHAMGLDFVGKDDLLRTSDVLSLHVPRTTSTLNWLAKAEFRLVRDDVVVINAARGGIVNEADLTDFLRSHPAAVYCGDVYAEEPYQGPLVEEPNTLLLPHIGASTHTSRLAMEIGAVANCVQILNGDACANVVTTSL